MVGAATHPLSDSARAAKGRVFLLDQPRYRPPSGRGQGVGGHDGCHAPAGGVCSGHRVIGGALSHGRVTGRHQAGGGRQRIRERPEMMADHRRPPYPDRTADRRTARPAPGGLVGRASRRGLLPSALAIPLPYPLPCPAPAPTAFALLTTAFRGGSASSQPSSLPYDLSWLSVVGESIGFGGPAPSAAGRGRLPAGGRTRTTGGRA
jgi:hypothetical protein